MLTAVMLLVSLAIARQVDAQPTVTREVTDGQEWVILDNGLLRLAVNPAERARIEALRHLPGGMELLKRNIQQESREPLLPVHRREVEGGAEDHFWGMVVQWKVNETRIVRAEVEQGAGVIETEGDHHGVRVRRTVTLPPDSLAVDIRVELFNATQERAVRSYWFHVLPEITRRGWAQEADWRVPDAADLTVVPQAELPPGTRARGQELWPEHGTVAVETAAFNTFFLPAQPWMAKWDPRASYALAVDFDRQDFRPDGLLFAGRLARPWPGRNSLEVVFGTRTLQPGKGTAYPLRLVVVPGSGKPLAFSASWALSQGPETFVLHALRPRPASFVEVVADNGTVAARLDIPALLPGERHGLDLPGDLFPAELRLVGIGATETLVLCHPL